ncbi:MAG: flagellin [Firmicutes bacterium]|nr:flagellin [Bacillota bacterium]
MRINHNISSINAWKNLTITDLNMGKSLEKLSSGFRINRAADDAAGLAISEKMRGQARGLAMAQKNALDAISLIQTAEGALTETHNALQRMRELAVQAASDSVTDPDRAHLNSEVTQLIAEIDRIATTTQFNTQDLLDGAFTGTFHIGANAGQTLVLSIGDCQATAIGTGVGAMVSDVVISTQAGANTAIGILDDAINDISTIRAGLGAAQNRLEFTWANLGAAYENISAAESRIRDTDMALEMAAFTRHQILLQSGTAMLAQANMKPQSMLQLLSS